MCGIAGLYSFVNRPVEALEQKLTVMNELIAHRGPDDQGIWKSKAEQIGLAHRRLSIIDLSSTAHQPMIAGNGNVIIFNGEIYNYRELRERLASSWDFKSTSDTEVILAAYARYGADCLQYLRGMFAFALWDGERLFCARDRFGIKPFYYAVVEGTFIFASETKAILPFLPDIETDPLAFSEYVTFQQPVSDYTLFKQVKKLLPGHFILLDERGPQTRRYWDVHYEIDYDHNADYFESRLAELLHDSVDQHLVSDVDVGCYVSGGIDSSLIAGLATEHLGKPLPLFHGRFSYGDAYDESQYAQAVAEQNASPLHVIDINEQDFINNIEKIIYHLDYPVAGPGSFPQYMVSQLVSKHVKVVLGGQGGDEIFGGYARYVLAYFEQCIKAAIEGTSQNGNFVVTPESILPNLQVLKEYKPLIKQFWSKGLFEDLDKRYFSLVNRSADVKDEINWDEIDLKHAEQCFFKVFNNVRNVRKEAYFDSMTHFDFKCLLPALLHVEDRVSMAHGVEARVPFLNHKLVEFMATVPADVKFTGGKMKRMLTETFPQYIPNTILQRRDKMGFPVPLNEWSNGELKEFIFDIFNTGKNRDRRYLNYDAIFKHLQGTSKFSRKLWGFLSLELWHQVYHDKASDYRKLVSDSKCRIVGKVDTVKECL